MYQKVNEMVFGEFNVGNNLIIRYFYYAAGKQGTLLRRVKVVWTKWKTDKVRVSNAI